jgi:hypothetical protein
MGLIMLLFVGEILSRNLSERRGDQLMKFDTVVANPTTM